MKDKIYIFGHKNPDTDSVCSAICLSYLQNELGFNTEARILSNINNETKYVLKQFKIHTPEILNDAKLQVKDVNYHKDFTINYNESVYNAYYKMSNIDVSTIPVVDDNNKFVGLFAMKDIAKEELLGDISTLSTNYDHILNAIKGKEIIRIDNKIEGNIIDIHSKSVTSYNNDLLNNKSILIIGDKHPIIEDAINKKIKLIIMTNNIKIKNEYLDIAKNNKINVIYTKLNTYEVLTKISFSSYIKSYNYIKNATCINENYDVTYLNEIINKTKHSYYPVIDNYNRCLGLIKLSDLRDYNKKKVILVDHNELSQSVDGLEEAEIISIIDHHKLGNLGTTTPINFRNMTVGSTCTIIYYLFKENKIKIPNDIGGLLLSGLISDTLLLKSPTTTSSDIEVYNELVKLTKIDAKKLALGMFKANDAVNAKSLKDIIYMDFKKYNIDKKVIAISVITTLNSKAILKQKNSYIKFLNKESLDKDYDIEILIITDIFKNGSYILFNSDSKDIIKNAFGDSIEQGDFIPKVISRKKQVLPAILNSLN
jgi:manganese-dependent inorganic pyrophosphatase